MIMEQKYGNTDAYCKTLQELDFRLRNMMQQMYMHNYIRIRNRRKSLYLKGMNPNGKVLATGH